MTVLAVGLMSGTSLDGIDAALVAIEGPSQVTLRAFRTTPYAPADRTSIHDAITRGGARDLALLHVELGRQFAAAAEAVLDGAAVTPDEVAFVASHGHTVWHEPGVASLQLGDPAIIAEQLGLQVVSDFRTRDVAAGGQGAPLVPIADAMLFGHPRRGRVLVNVGGMANLTWVPQRGVLEGVIAFDSGPGVAVLDAVTRMADPAAPFDVDGGHAARGRVCEPVVHALLQEAYFVSGPPKSTGRERFGDVYARELVRHVRDADGSEDDAIATAAALTARSIAEAVRHWVPVTDDTDVLVSGGGVRHPALFGELRSALHPMIVRPFEEEFFDGGAKEAVVFAYLGWLTMEGRPGNVPSATGAAGGRVLGRVTPV